MNSKNITNVITPTYRLKYRMCSGDRKLNNNTVQQQNNLSDNHIVFLSNMKRSIDKQNDLLDAFEEEIYNSDYYYQSVSSVCQMSSYYTDDNKLFLKKMLKKKERNRHLSTYIESQLYNRCLHEIIDDTIDVGLDGETKKIKYCSKCELNM